MHIAPDMLLRMKPIYPIYRITPTSFRIGAQIDVTIEIDDPDGQVWTLVNLLDGTRTFPEIVHGMQKLYPTLSTEDIAQGLQTLDNERFIEDARSCIYDLNHNGPARRFIGNVNYFSHFTHLGDSRTRVQDKLLSSKVVLLGLGGAGSNILPLLVSSGIGTIVAVDYDYVELTNLNRQFLYRESDIGLLKTQVAERAVAAMNSSINFSTVTKKIESAEDVQPIIRGADLVICAIDEPPFLAQRRVNYACIAENVVCLYGFTQVSRGRIFSVIPHQTGCFDCLHINYAKKDDIFELQLKGFFESGFDAPTISFVPQISRLSGTIVDEAVRLLTNYTAPLSIATQLELDYISGSLVPLLKWDRYEQECPTCGYGHEDQFPGVTAYPGAVSLKAFTTSHAHE